VYLDMILFLDSFKVLCAVSAFNTCCTLSKPFVH